MAATTCGSETDKVCGFPGESTLPPTASSSSTLSSGTALVDGRESVGVSPSTPCVVWRTLDRRSRST